MAEENAPPDDKIKRKFIGIRVFFILVAVLCFFVTLLVLGNFPGIEQEPAWSALEKLIIAIGAGVLSDMARPSGMKKSAFSIVGNSALGVKAP